MLPELDANVLIYLLGLAALAGMTWNRLSGVEESIEENNSLIREQNSRIDKLEQWRAEQRGHREGFREAKDRYEDGPDRKLQG